MASEDDLTAERAALQKFYYSLNAGVEGGRHQEADEQQDIDRLMALLKTARQEALMEAKERLQKRVQYYAEQECQSEGRMRLTRGLQLNEASGCLAEMDRLASEGG